MPVSGFYRHSFPHNVDKTRNLLNINRMKFLNKVGKC